MENKKLFILVDSFGRINTIEDLKDSLSDDVYETSEEAINNFTVDDDMYILEVEIKSIKTDSITPKYDSLQEINLK